MTFLYFSVAFNPVDHNIFIKRVKTEFGVEGIALIWFKSQLSIRSYENEVNGTISDAQSFAMGMFLRAKNLDLFYTHYIIKNRENKR